MSRKDIFEIALLIFFIFIIFFLFVAGADAVRRINSFIEYQEKLNARTYEADERQDKDLRLLKQDAEITQRIINTKEFLEEED